VVIHFDGLAERVTRVPVDADNIGGLELTDEAIVYLTVGAPFYGRELLEAAAERVLARGAGGSVLARG
jgi:hypothetical protein